MAWGESKVWLRGELKERHYQNTLQDAAERPERDKRRRKIVKPHEMPWELAPQGLLKHMVNDQMDVRVETVDIYMQVIPPGSRSGKHRHLAEEALYVLEGKGYDMHWDCNVEIDDTYHWIPEETPKRFEWEAGDMIYIPPNTIHQHFNADPSRPARLVSAINRIYKYSGLNDLEQVENAPEYDPNLELTPAVIEEIIAGKRTPKEAKGA